MNVKEGTLYAFSIRNWVSTTLLFKSTIYTARIFSRTTIIRSIIDLKDNVNRLLNLLRMYGNSWSKVPFVIFSSLVSNTSLSRTERRHTGVDIWLYHYKRVSIYLYLLFTLSGNVKCIRHNIKCVLLWSNPKILLYESPIVYLIV